MVAFFDLSIRKILLLGVKATRGEVKVIRGTLEGTTTRISGIKIWKKPENLEVKKVKNPKLQNWTKTKVKVKLHFSAPSAGIAELEQT